MSIQRACWYTRRRCTLLRSTPLPAYASPTPCPVLTERMVLCPSSVLTWFMLLCVSTTRCSGNLGACARCIYCRISGTKSAFGAMRICYAPCRTDLGEVQRNAQY
eukprot:1738827-Rhodomonas_salina.5